MKVKNNSAKGVTTNFITGAFLLTGAMFADMLEDLKQARHFIFLEYFIIHEGKMWNQILEILEEKAKG